MRFPDWFQIVIVEMCDDIFAEPFDIFSTIDVYPSPYKVIKRFPIEKIVGLKRIPPFNFCPEFQTKRLLVDRSQNSHIDSDPRLIATSQYEISNQSSKLPACAMINNDNISQRTQFPVETTDDTLLSSAVVCNVQLNPKLPSLYIKEIKWGVLSCLGRPEVDDGQMRRAKPRRLPDTALLAKLLMLAPPLLSARLSTDDAGSLAHLACDI